jgi:hypothetical protein
MHHQQQPAMQGQVEAVLEKQGALKVLYWLRQLERHSAQVMVFVQEKSSSSTKT